MITAMYDKDGRETTNEEAALAKQVNNTYFVKFVNVGPDRGHIANPYSMWYNEPLHTGKNRMVSKLGVHALEFKKVSVEVYTAYVKFLMSRIASYYRHAERQLIDG